MRNLIKKILEEYHNPVLVYEISFSKTLNENELIRVDKNKDFNLRLLKNYHSEKSIGDTSSLQRVDIESIDSSIKEIQPEFIYFVKKVLKFCEGKDRCGFVVVDDPNGFDYHVWVRKGNDNEVNVVINTSIYHPRHLYNTKKDPVLYIDRFGDISHKKIK